MGHMKFGKNLTKKEKKKRKRAEKYEKKKKAKIIEKESFSEVDIPDVLKTNLERNFKFTTMTPIQSKTIPTAILHPETDVIAQAATGSGKTLAFLVPIATYLIKKKFKAKKGLGAVVLAPTRELAFQIYEVAQKLLKGTKVTHACVMGGTSKWKEIETLQSGVNLIVASPGRLLDHLRTTEDFKTKHLKFLVLDEADLLIDIGFEKDIKYISLKLPRPRTTYLFSATLGDKVEELASLSMQRDPIRVGIGSDSNVSTLNHKYIKVKSSRKLATLLNLIKNNQDKKVILFMSTKISITFMEMVLQKFQIDFVSMHGNKTQDMRTNTYDDFTKMEKGLLVATNVAARGLDFPDVHLIVQFDIPEEVAQYFHRAGRTARAGKKGTALLLLTPTEQKKALPVFQQILDSKKGDKQIEVYEEKLDQIEDLHKQLRYFVKSDRELKSKAYKTIQVYQSVFRMFMKTLNFKRDEFDERGLTASFGL